MTEKSRKRDFFDKTVEIYAWLEVIIASIIVGLITGAAIYFSRPDPIRLYLAIASIILSLVIGGFLANMNRKEKWKIHQEATSVQSFGAVGEKGGQAESKQSTS
jgi:hypothetical protein